MSVSDEALARILQAEFDQEDQGGTSLSSPYLAKDASPSRPIGSSSSKPMSLIDRQWELLDPTPDPRALFLQFNDQFFWGKLAGVEVRWSPRMTLCAGVCSYEGFGGLCSIRLSVPLLKLRPRKDLVETLLHEMIHAYLFVTQNNRDRDGHGPEFCKHMDRINKESGTKITIYHSFHDEVDNYRQHWWRCDGPCRSRKPYFGYVKRAMNRAPSRQDTWWASHQQTCGGTFTKVKEPEGYSNKKRKKDEKGGEDSEKENNGEGAADKKQKRESQDIRNFIPFTGQGQRLGGSASSSKIFGPGNSSKGTNHKGQVEIKHPWNNPNSKSNSVQSAVDGSNQNGKSKVEVVESNPSRKDKNQKNKSVENGRVFDLTKREKKLEELRSIFVSDSEDEDDIFGSREVLKKQREDNSSVKDKNRAWENLESGRQDKSSNRDRNDDVRERSNPRKENGFRTGSSISSSSSDQLPRNIDSGVNRDRDWNRNRDKYRDGVNDRNRPMDIPHHWEVDDASTHTSKSSDFLSGVKERAKNYSSSNNNNKIGTKGTGGMFPNRNIDNPSSSSSSSRTKDVIDIGGNGAFHSVNGGIKRTNHPSGQTSLDQFVSRPVVPIAQFASSTHSSAASGGAAVGQDNVKYVKCPVCGKNVIENQINSHLDSCLSGFG